MKLPTPALVELAKLRDYCLNPSHQEGKHKARVFDAALGINAEDAEWLREELLSAAADGSFLPTTRTAHGQRYVLDFPIQRQQRTAMIRSAWIIRPGEKFPRLVTCYVL